ncbi:MAG: methionine adenosyltransferase [Candidatus ainarchaeum sp.]|nr:methionine adenosyltransferase [Candidatus ainarchaeum sp.]
MRKITLECIRSPKMGNRLVEVVERKGLGHPDTICDSIMNEVSVQLCKEYMKKFGAILHHNTDKSLLVAGGVEHAFGGGKMLEPMKLIFGDRASYGVKENSVDVESIAEQAAHGWFRKNMRFVDPNVHLRCQNEIKPGSAELVDIFNRKAGKFLPANDTSAAVGYAPMSETERLVLELEKHYNSREFKGRHPESGEDIKVMGMRNRDALSFTVAMGFIERFVESEDAYFKKKEEVRQAGLEFLRAKTGKKVALDLNTLDVRGRGINGVYLSLLGTSAEDGDCGQVGRGNRVNGLIPLNRPGSSEAAAGKNPVSHIGKIYNLLTYRIAERIYGELGNVGDTYVWLLSQIGKPVDQPHIIAVQCTHENGLEEASLKPKVDDIIEDEFDHLDRFIDDLAKGKLAVA